MEEKTIIFINEVYIDLLNKSDCNQNILKRVKLINRLLKEQYAEEIYVLSRSTYEETMKELVAICEPQFKADVKTQPGEFRNKVIDNINTLFGECIIDSQMIKGTYDYLSKTTHESMIKRLLCDLASNEKAKYATECNTHFVLCTIIYIYLCHLYKDNKVLEFINKLFIKGMDEMFIATFNFLIKLTPAEREYYKGYFITQRDVKLLNEKTEEIHNAILEIDNEIHEDEPIYNLDDIDRLIEENGYKDLYHKIILNK